jgi:hypothetical protein
MRRGIVLIAKVSGQERRHKYYREADGEYLDEESANGNEPNNKATEALNAPPFDPKPPEKPRLGLRSTAWVMADLKPAKERVRKCGVCGNELTPYELEIGFSTMCRGCLGPHDYSEDETVREYDFIVAKVSR